MRAMFAPGARPVGVGMTELADYADPYEGIRCTRMGEVLEVVLHTDRGTFAFSEEAHHDLGFAFGAIADDPHNAVVILTGTGDCFCVDFDYSGFARVINADPVRVAADLDGRVHVGTQVSASASSCNKRTR